MNEPAKQPSPDAGSRPSLEALWEEAEYLPCKLSVALQVPKLTVGDLLDMEVNSVIDCRVSRDAALPVWVNEVIIGSAEFEVVGRRLAVRITELR